jgi:hypothetical protein
MNIDKIIEAKYSEHQLELYNLEKNLEEYKEKIWHNGKIVKRDINSEKQIRIEESYYKFVKSLKLLGFEHWGYSESPVMKPIMPGATSDWDFSSTGWVLDTATYISPPSSFRATDILVLLCKYTGTTVLSQGRIKTYFRLSSGVAPDYFQILFRNQASVGSANYNNSYKYYLGTDGTKFTYYSNGTEYNVPGGSETKSISKNTWYQIQVTWWIDTGGAGLMARCEIPPGTNWVRDFNHSANLWATSSINRCGFYCYYIPTYIDDTEIWGP